MRGFNVAGKAVAEVQGCLPIDCTELSLQIAAQQLGPSFIYILHVHPRNVLSMRGLLRRMGCDVEGNVLAPYVNLMADPNVPRVGSWYLEKAWPESDGVCVGSEGY